MNNKLTIVAAVAVLSCVSYAWATSTRAHSVEAGSAAAAQVQDGGRVEGHRAFDFDARVGGVLEMSILPRAVDANATPVRAISAVLLYQKATAYLGTANFHQLVPIGSDQTIDLSLSGLDLSIDQLEAIAPSEMRSFRATLKPRAGLTWDSVRTFKDDVVLEYSAL